MAERLHVPIVTLLSDFGSEDGYVASMKGVILSRCPGACLVDVTHQVPPFDIRSGSYVLKTILDAFPPDTIHVAVVDPGVGTARKALAVKLECGSILVGPDNGLLSWVLAMEARWEARSLENPDTWRSALSQTFHGRDLFAPVAAHLALGFPFDQLGPRCSPEMGSWLRAGRRDGKLLGEVVHVDHFGNLITNITEEDLGGTDKLAAWVVELCGTAALPGIAGTYGDVPPGAPTAVMGSSGHLEIAVNQGHAARILSAGTGTEVIVFVGNASGGLMDD
jgi:hypothetical protein